MITTALATIALAAASPSGGHCYRLGGSSAGYYPINDHTILVSQGVHAYKITTSPSVLLADRYARLTVRFTNSDVVCSPLEMDIRVSSTAGRAGLIVQDITPLSPRAAEYLRHGGPSYRNSGL